MSDRSLPGVQRKRGGIPPWGILLIVGAVVLLIWVVAASAGGGSRSGDGGDSKYTQTWGKSYSDTSCNDWNTAMSEKQRWAAAADMLTGARNKGDGGEGVPPDSLVDVFESGITTACITDGPITDIAVGLYLTERQRFAP